MKKKLNSNHIIFTCGSLFALMIISFKANAQIIYTDIVPDYTSEELYDGYNLDLNNDQMVDYVIASYSDSEYYLLIVGTDQFNSIISVDPWYTHPVPLDSGYVIGQHISPLQYYTGGLFTVDDCYGGNQYCFNSWINQQDKYLGLRFFFNGSTHYGWARMDYTSFTEWTIKDYAYEATPNTPIMAGQMVLGVEEPDLTKVKVWVENKKLSIINLTDRTAYNLYTINGQKILQGELLPNRDSIDVQNLTTGLYILELMDTNSLSTLKRKILIP